MHPPEERLAKHISDYGFEKKCECELLRIGHVGI
jgi:hypothetical protein